MQYRTLLSSAAVALSLASFAACSERAPADAASGGTTHTGGSGSSAAAGGSTGDDGGTGGTGGGILGERAPDSAFVLSFRDEFDALDASRWQLMTHSWGTNLALFSEESVTVADSQLTLTLRPAPEGTVDDQDHPKSFLGAEVRSVDALTYGRVRARAKLADGSAVVSSIVTIYTPWPADDWNELDIEFLGADDTEVQFNAMVYLGPETTPPVTTSVAPTQDPEKVDLGFDPAADFHEYTIEWTPEGAHFLVDDVLLHTWTENIALMDLPQNVLLTIWASSSPAWAGAVDDSTPNARAVYDWVELYEYAP